ncbi:MAG: RluA family pseudouridine synthase [Actinobacteria bacterium]|nr:RluA family pseudouridine synthase [Actinomycetota bacterium]
METGWSRAEVQALAAAGGVLVDGKPAAKSLRLATGQHVVVVGAPADDAPPEAEDVPVEVRYTDDDLYVVHKPAGLVVHPGAGHAHGTLVHGLLAIDPAIAGVGDPERPGIVHRLDRDTSGLMVVARTPEAYEALVAALARRDVGREYVALVWGHPENARGVIDAPIGRSTSRRTRMAVRREGKDARTVYEVREWFVHPDVARLDCRLETGRTHQIRVHLAAIGHPVVGDGTYGGNRPGIRLDRPFLHAARLSFTHPRTGEPLAFEEPLPAELAETLERLRDGGPG